MAARRYEFGDGVRSVVAFCTGGREALGVNIDMDRWCQHQRFLRMLQRPLVANREGGAKCYLRKFA